MTDKKERYKQAAITIAYSICRDAVWSGNCCSWIGDSIEDYYGAPKGYAKALGANFYDGTSGIAWFLSCMYQLCQDPIIEQTAKGALQHIIDTEITNGEKQEDFYGKLGFHTGWAGCAYVLQHASEIFGEEKYCRAVKQLIEKMIKLPREFWGIDIINGAAGALIALLSIYKKHPSASLNGFILTLGDWLIEKGDKQEHGWSWDTMESKKHNLTGYAHGAAGIGHAFAELYSFTGNPQYLQIAQAAAGYENYYFNKEHNNWPDFRASENIDPLAENKEDACGMAWCHGAPGIGLSRLRAYQITNKDFFRRDVEIALQNVIDSSSIFKAGNYSMCHGLFGNAELLIYASEILENPSYFQKAEQIGDRCIMDYMDKRKPIPNGLNTQPQPETPDFMLGSSGIAYFFLRLYDPELFPSILIIIA